MLHALHTFQPGAIINHLDCHGYVLVTLIATTQVGMVHILKKKYYKHMQQCLGVSSCDLTTVSYIIISLNPMVTPLIVIANDAQISLLINYTYAQGLRIY